MKTSFPQNSMPAAPVTGNAGFRFSLRGNE